MDPEQVKLAVEIDEEINGDRAWTKSKWYKMHNRPNAALVSAKWGEKTIGAMAIEVYAKRVRIYRLLVDPWHRFNGVGTWMFFWVCGICGSRGITMDVREDDLGAQKFLGSLGLRGKIKTKPKSVRDGWRVPETIGEDMFIRFTMPESEVPERCRSQEVVDQ